MIVITGAAGFIASCLITRLNQDRFFDLVLVDDFSHEEKRRNYEDKTYKELVDRKVFPEWLRKNEDQVQFNCSAYLFHQPSMIRFFHQ